MNDKIKKLNETMQNGYNGPKTLFKYRPFDQYTFDMLENNYIFLCKAAYLDDKSECNTSIDIDKFIDAETNNCKRVAVLEIINMLKTYTSKENFELVSSMIMRITKDDGTVKPNFLLDIVPDISNLMPEVDIAPFINWVVGIPEKLNDPTIKPQLEMLIKIALNSKNLIGICSLCESMNVDRMWEEYYADYDAGYCIEYDVANYELNKNIFPVYYSDYRDTEIITQLVSTFIGDMIRGFSYNKILADKTQFLRLFLTKNTEWEYQREWRFIGDANAKVEAPKIKNIYLGKKVKEENRVKISEYCLKNNINLIQR